jgi:hypothetical protein
MAPLWIRFLFGLLGLLACLPVYATEAPEGNTTNSRTEDELAPGSYYCYIRNAAGIQPKGVGTADYAGEIDFRERGFMATIKKIDSDGTFAWQDRFAVDNNSLVLEMSSDAPGFERHFVSTPPLDRIFLGHFGSRFHIVLGGFFFASFSYGGNSYVLHGSCKQY